MMRRAIYAWLLLISAIGCNRRPEWQSFGPDVQASVVIVFKEGARQADINQVLENCLFDKTPNSKGDWPKPGVGAVVQSTVQGHNGYSVQFTAEATPERQRSVLGSIRASSIVLHVFRNIAPKDIVLDRRHLLAKD